MKSAFQTNYWTLDGLFRMSHGQRYGVGARWEAELAG
jgi:hypothetical protein